MWSYSDTLTRDKNCKVCKTYRDYCLKILQQRWNKNWGEFNFVMSKITKNDKHFLDVSKYFSADRHLIVQSLKKKKQEK